MATTKPTPYEPGPVGRRVLELARKGLGPSDIARILGISHQRASQHLANLRTRGLIP